MREVKKERLDVVHWANERVEEERGEGGRYVEEERDGEEEREEK